MKKLDELDGFPNPYSYGAFEREDSLFIYLHWGGVGGGVTHSIAGNKQ